MTNELNEIDKRRLRFLLDQFRMVDAKMDGRHVWHFRNHGWPMPLVGDSIENAIDAAIEKTSKAGGEKDE